MAARDQVVRVLFKAVDNMTATVNKIDTAFAGLGDAAEPLKKLADNILEVEKVIAALAAGSIAYAAYKFSEFETSTTSLSKIISKDLRPQVEGIADNMIEMSNEFGIASSVLLDTATDFKRAGAEIDQLNKLTEDSVKLFAAAAESEYELGDATATIVRVLKGFRLSFDESGQVIDTVNKLANEYATSVSQLSEGLARVSPVAKDMGLSIQEAAAYVTPLIEVFQSGEIAGQALSTTFQRMRGDQAPVIEALQELGVSQRDYNGEMKSGKQLLEEIATAFGKVDKNEQGLIATRLTGIRQAPKALLLLGAWEDAQKKVSVAISGTGSATAELAARMKDSQKQFDRVASSFNNIFIKFGEQIKLSTATGASAVADLFIAIQKEIDSGTFDPLIQSVTDAGDKMADIFKSVAENMPKAFEDLDFSDLIKSFENLQTQVKEILSAMFGDVDLTTVQGLTDALQNIVDAVELVNNVTAGIVDAWTPIIGIFSDITLALAGMSKESQDVLGHFLGWSSAAVTVAAGVGSVSLAILGLVKAFGSLKLVIISLITLLSGPVGVYAAVVAVGAVIGATIGTILRQLPDVDRNMQATIKSLDKFFNLGIGGSQTETELGFINDRFEEAKILSQALRESVDDVSTSISKIPDPLPDTYTTGMENFKKSVTETEQKILDLVVAGEDIPDDLFDFQMTFTNQEELENQKSQIEGLKEKAEEMQAVFSEEIVLQIELDSTNIDEKEKALAELARERSMYIRASADEESIEAAEAKIKAAIESGDADREALIKAQADLETLKNAQDYIKTEVAGVKYYSSIGVRVDQPTKKKTLEELAKDLPAEKKIKVLLEVEKTKLDQTIKTLEIAAETTQTKFEWQAKLDIANVQAGMEKAVAMSDTLAEAFKASGAILGDLFKVLAGDIDYGVYKAIERQIRVQNDLQERKVVILEKQFDLQNRIETAKIERLRSGNPLIEIKTEGLRPHMKAFIFELIEDVQIFANQDGGEALLNAAYAEP